MSEKDSRGGRSFPLKSSGRRGSKGRLAPFGSGNGGTANVKLRKAAESLVLRQRTTETHCAPDGRVKLGPQGSDGQRVMPARS